MIVSSIDLSDGTLEEFLNIYTVGELRQAIAAVDDDMPVRDGRCQPLVVTIVRPKHLKPYVEVQ